MIWNSIVYTQVAKHQSRCALIVNRTLFNKLQTHLDTKTYNATSLPFQNSGFQKTTAVKQMIKHIKQVCT